MSSKIPNVGTCSCYCISNIDLTFVDSVAANPRFSGAVVYAVEVPAVGLTVVEDLVMVIAS